jgi:hypothetical protein
MPAPGSKGSFGNRTPGNANARRGPGKTAPTTTAAAGRTFTPGAHLAKGTPVRTATGSFRVGSFSRPAAAVIPGRNAPAARAFVHPGAPITTSNYPHPHYGNTYITNNTTVIENNYRYDSRVYAPHVANFYYANDPIWGNHWRYGCYASPSVSFGFGFYCYTPFYAACVASPWYYYPAVPAYVPQTRVIVLSNYDYNWDYGTSYSYQPTVAYASYGDPEFNQAVSVFSGVYLNVGIGGFDAVFDPVAPIAVWSEGHYCYSLAPTDFRSMCFDTCRSTHTYGYDILGVHKAWRGADRSYVVYARHTFENPHGGREVVYQQYRMHRGGSGRYVVTDFNTSHRAFRNYR